MCMYVRAFVCVNTMAETGGHSDNIYSPNNGKAPKMWGRRQVLTERRKEGISAGVLYFWDRTERRVEMNDVLCCQQEGMRSIKWALCSVCVIGQDSRAGIGCERGCMKVECNIRYNTDCTHSQANGGKQITTHSASQLNSSVFLPCLFLHFFPHSSQPTILLQTFILLSYKNII